MKKCSSVNCDSTIAPNFLCIYCNNTFCMNCMYLTCKICHVEYGCYICGRIERDTNNFTNKCIKHKNINKEKCEIGKKCGCKQNKQNKQK